MQPSLQKLIQKRVYDVLSNKYGLVLVIAGMLFCVGSVFMFGEAMVEWSRDKYAAVFNSFSDNIARKSFQSRLCLPVPIDVVYTWVNGSDPELLMNLKRYKLELEQELNFTGSEGEKNNKEGKCTFSQCVQVLSVVLEPDLQREITMEYLRKNAPLFSAAVEMFPVTLPTKNKQNFTVVTFREEEHVLGITNNSYVIIQGHNHTVHKAFITSDWTVQHSILLHDTIIMSGFPHKFSSEQLRAALPEKYRNGVTKLDLHDDRGIAVLYVPKRSEFDGLLELNNLTIEGKEPTLNAANLVWDLTESIEGDVASASRFQDNEELRYSIRSLERFAPWIRHIYIVTNGQIPSWLNLDHAGVTLVTHEEIFANTSHLPTFSSPAIEAHIHRIPGLSDKFIYLNDDVMFGKEVWPDDFYTHSRGQKVYLSWPVPNCQEGCPSNWIRDGYCDKACNNSQCDWDGGDCDGSSNASNQGGGQGGFFFNSNQDNSKMYCASGCANNWIADKYCDQSCNVKPCGFDAADCGTENFNQLYAVDFSPKVTQYTIPRGEYLLYLNLSRLLGEDGVITEATYNKSEVVRTAAVALKFKVLTVVLYENHNQSLLSFSLRGNGGSEDSQFHHNFTLLVDTRPGPQSEGRNESHVPNKTAELTGPAKPNMSHPDNTTEGAEPVFVFEDIPQNLRAARAGVRSDIEMDEPGHSVNLSSLPLPTDLQEEWVQIQTQLKDGDITEKGFYRLKMSIWQQMTERGQQNETVRHLVESHKKAEGMRQMDSVLKPHRGRSLLSIDMLGAVIGLDKETQRRHPLIWSKGNNSDGVLLENLFKPGGLPWERAGVFAELVKKKDALERKLQYLSNSRGTRRSLNQFADSLRHVNRIYNREFGYSARKVPSHMPHMVDKHVMAELQERFPEEWDATSSHRVRSSTDMQFAFSYFYYLMGVSRNTTAEEVFDMMDTDHSNVLSDREIRTLATRLYTLPLDLQTLTGLENTMIDCSKTLAPELFEQVPEASTESYYVNNMPQVTKNLFINCSGIQELLRKNFQPQPLYKYDIVGDDSEVAFKMIKTNVSSVVGQLDDIRKHPKKFICLNDNIDHESTDAKTVKAILVDFYESMFPIPSQFELPRDYRNRFLRVEELREWKKYRDWLKFWTNIALAFLVIFALMSFFGDKIDALQRSLSRRRPSPPPDPSSPESPRPVGLVESV